MASPPPSLEAFEDMDDDGDSDNNDNDEYEDEDTNSSDDDVMTTRLTCHLLFVTKRGSSFRYESSLVLRGRVSIGDR